MTNEQKADQRVQRFRSRSSNAFKIAELMDWDEDELSKLCELSIPNIANVELEIFFDFRKMIMDEREAKRIAEYSKINEKYIKQSIENEKSNQNHLRAMKWLTIVLASATLIQAIFLALTFIFK